MISYMYVCMGGIQYLRGQEENTWLVRTCDIIRNVHNCPVSTQGGYVVRIGQNFAHIVHSC